MPYINGATSSAPHVASLITTISAFLVANGWTLFDTVSATDLVFFSTGTGRERIFVRLTQSTNRIIVRAYAFWDAGTNTGYNQAGSDTDGVDGDNTNAFAFWVWTDGRAVLIAAKVSSSYHGVMAGSLDRIADSSIGFTQADVAAGADITVALDQSFPTKWAVGKKLMVIDQDATLAAAGAVPTEHATITSVAVGSVNLTLAAAHKAGAMVGEDPQPVFKTRISNIVWGDVQVTNDCLGWQTAAGRNYADTVVPFESRPDAASISDRTGRHLQAPIYIANDTDAGTYEVRGKLPGVLAFADGAGTGVSAEDTTEIAGETYIALPIGSGGQPILIPTF